MLVAAATVKDTPAHVRRFVEGNLGGGLDHLVVFVDQPGGDGQSDVVAHLEQHPHVTCVRAGREWWGGARPRELNERQCTNANAVKEVLADLGVDGWLFHVDGDEVVRLDAAALAAVPPRLDVVRLQVREAVSRMSWVGEPTLFKRELGDDDLQLLATLGALDTTSSEPSNRSYFHGHLQGKAGVRPGATGWLTLHKVVGRDRSALAMHEDDRLELFHYESYSGADFVRKWTAMVASGPRASFRPGRARTARALRTLIEKDLPTDVLETYLLRVYERTCLDDVDTLQGLDLLLETDPLAGAHLPAPAPPGLLDAIGAGLDALRGRPKDHLFRGSSVGGA